MQPLKDLTPAAWRLARVESRRSLREPGFAGSARRFRARRARTRARSRPIIAASSRRSPATARPAPSWARRWRATRRSQDLLGRIMSFASLLYAGDMSDPARAKFYADAHDKVIDASTQFAVLPARTQSLDDAALDAAASTPPLAHWLPWLEDIRKEKPYRARRQDRGAVPRKVCHRRAQLESPVRRDHRQPAIHRRRRGAGHRARAQFDAGSRAKACAARPPRRWARR